MMSSVPDNSNNINFRICTFNANSLVAPGRIEELEETLVSSGIDICLLQETFFKKIHKPQFNNFNLVLNNRMSNSKGGGTAIVISKKIKFEALPLESIVRMEVLEGAAVAIKLVSGGNLFLISLYNRKAAYRFSGEITSLLHRLNCDSPNNHFVIGGDFNALHSDWGCPRTYTRGNELCNLISDLRPRFGTVLATSVWPSRPSAGTYPDLFIYKDSITNPSDYLGKNCLRHRDLGFSDHILIEFDCKMGMSIENDFARQNMDEPRLLRLRSGVKSIHPGVFQRKLTKMLPLNHLNVESLATQTLDPSDLDELTERVTSVIVEAMERSLPRRGVYSGSIPRNIKRETKRKNVLVKQLLISYRLGIQSGPVISDLKSEIRAFNGRIKKLWSEYNTNKFFNKIDRISNSRNTFFRDINNYFDFKQRSTDDRESFLLNVNNDRTVLGGVEGIELDGGEILVFGKQQVAEVLSNDLEQTFMPSESDWQYDCNRFLNRKTQFSPENTSVDPQLGSGFVGMGELKDSIKAINSKTSFGPDGIPNCIIKLFPKSFLEILLILFNNCININYIPKLWRISSVVFIKKDKKIYNNIKNYRPISLMSNISKLLERIFTDRLLNNIEEHSLISDRQFGFRPHCSTVHAINYLVNKIQSYRCDGGFAAVLFVDLSRAFDSVSHSVLVSILNGYNIDDDTVNFFANFIKGRTFFSTHLTNSIENVDDLGSLVGAHGIGRGVLQGSISGPVLFSLYMDSILRSIAGSVAYADDLAIIAGGRDAHEVQRELQERFCQLEESTRQLLLKINPSKTRVMVFRKQLARISIRNRVSLSNFNINTGTGELIQVVDKYSYLGVDLDRFLKFNSHFEKAVAGATSLFRSCYSILKLELIPKDRRVLFYTAIIRPILEYACPIWVLATPFLIGKLEKIEYRILNTIFGNKRCPMTGRYTSYRVLLSGSQLPSISYHIIKISRKYMDKLDVIPAAKIFPTDGPNWALALEYINEYCFVPEVFMFLDRLRIIQNEEGCNRLFSLKRHGLAKDFNLEEALNVDSPLRKIRRPTEYDLKTIVSDYYWMNWPIPEWMGLF